MEKKNTEISSLVKLSVCIKKISEKNEYLKDDDLLQITKDLIQIKEEIERDLSSALDIIKEMKLVVHNSNMESKGGIITSDNTDDLDHGFNGTPLGR